MKQLKFDNVINSAVLLLYSDHINAVINPPYLELDMTAYKVQPQRFCKYTNLTYFVNKDVPRISHQKGEAMAKKLEEEVFYFKSSTKPIFKNKHPKSYKHHKEQEFIEDRIAEQWNCGIAISIKKDHSKKILMIQKKNIGFILF